MDSQDSRRWFDSDAVGLFSSAEKTHRNVRAFWNAPVLHSSASLQRSAVDILNEAPGQRLFKTAEDVVSFLWDERASWDR